MKKDIHPEYRDVVFHDVSADMKIKTRSCAPAKDTVEIDGEEYPCIKIDISAASHPFYTGKQKFVDTAGRVEKFKKKFGQSYVAKTK